MKILVVDDSKAIRTFLKRVLEQNFECTAVEAESGFHALRLLPRHTFEMVITDINMPDINGMELIRFIRQSARHERVPLIIISTQTSEKNRVRVIELGADCFVAKPFDPKTIIATVERFLASREKVKQITD